MLTLTRKFEFCTIEILPDYFLHSHIFLKTFFLLGMSEETCVRNIDLINISIKFICARSKIATPKNYTRNHFNRLFRLCKKMNLPVFQDLYDLYIITCHSYSVKTV